ncbi:MAG: hypothetical protein HQM08_15540 [Candidatus Riflebacteria bacterium]|nr:hypothetical protein [Candidatus Riflebacteria bacterium]
MNIFPKKLTIAFCFSMLIAGFLPARQVPTTLSNDPEPIDKAIVSITPLTVQGNFLTTVVGKIMNVPRMSTIKETGFLFQALSNDAFQGIPSDPNGNCAQKIVPYLLNNKSMLDVLKLRRTSRQIKSKYVDQMLTQVDASQVSDEDRKALTSFFHQEIGIPLLILDKSPLPRSLPEPGPCMIPVGLEVLDKAKNRLFLDTLGVCIMDIPNFFSVDQAMQNDTLGLVICHETGHAIMFDQYGKAFATIKKLSRNGHDAPYITDIGLAYTEGWAEAFEAVYGPNNPKFLEQDRKKYNISEFLFSRQNPVRRDQYVWAKGRGKKTGELKNGLQLLSTEGVIAGFFYDILTSRAINAPFEKCVTVMGSGNPCDFKDFITQYIETYPDDKKVIYRILLENTKYMLMSPEVAQLYTNAFQAKLAFVSKKIPRDQYLQAEKAFTSKKEELFNQALNGGNIFANVGPELWFSGTLKMTVKHGWFDYKYYLQKRAGKDPDVWEFNLDLNTISEKMLVNIGVDSADAVKIITERKSKGFFTGDPIQILSQLLGNEKFEALKAKIQLKNYDVPVPVATPPSTPSPAPAPALKLYPEDIEHISLDSSPE